MGGGQHGHGFCPFSERRWIRLLASILLIHMGEYVLSLKRMFLIPFIKERDILRNLDITTLRSFVAVADSGGVTRAAGFLHLTQSAVSMQLKRL
jgi:DNA-binding MarR family transcriptional regulator